MFTGTEEFQRLGVHISPDLVTNSVIQYFLSQEDIIKLYKMVLSLEAL